MFSRGFSYCFLVVFLLSLAARPSTAEDCPAELREYFNVLRMFGRETQLCLQSEFREPGRKGWDADIPLKMRRIIHQVSFEAGLPPELIAAQLKTESNFRNVKGRDGEVGPAQILPIWADTFGLRREALDDELTNVRIYARIMKGYLQEFRSLKLSWVAYNSGKSTALRVKAAGGDLKEAPASTRAYIRTCISNLRSYLNKKVAYARQKKS